MSEIEFEEISGRNGNLGLITLTRQSALNALNQAMINAIDEQLAEWEIANHIKAVVIRADLGRAFCAGGDVRSVYDRKLANDPKLSDFFRDEYRMNRRIHHYSKPYIALMNGITMGGGVGISVHASHRIATDALLFAMPETGIGFYPDVGMTYILPRLPHKMGYYLGLSGARISLSDCAAAGLIDFSVKLEQFPELIYALADEPFESDARESVTQVIKKFSVPMQNSSLIQRYEMIEKCFSEKTIEKILDALDHYPDRWCQEVSAVLRTKSPTSLKVTLHALHAAAQLDFNEAMQVEFRLTSRFLQGHDFFEGVRAVLVDKDQMPKWEPAKLKDVTTALVKKYFEPLEKEV
ncbi:MAG TPA: enoyl-CoA hydratase/isomerase family protein [Gammaproteobacteria bacterium]|nr:enoyl-CoA hydratase/isomerase family protein [Gammaproteobacteria bacterium]